jgi:3-hydroxybutyryl-CoA dehydratase
MRPGDALPSRVLTITAAPMRVMAEVLRDPNPIHLDPKAVAAVGLGDRVINQGPANVAYVIDMLLTAFPGHRLQAIESRFLANVRDGDRVEAGGVISAVGPGQVSCDAWLKIEGGGTAVAVTATLTPRGE